MLMVAKAAAIALLAAASLALILTAPSPAEGGSSLQVAIVGGGIGGAAAAHFLRELCGDRVAIHVFEREHVGGRLLSMQYRDAVHELGGSMVYEDNIYIRQLADAMGLQRVDPGSGPDADSSPFSLYDGRRFVFNQSTWTAVNLWRMYWRYGTAPLQFQSRPAAMFRRFLRIYELQGNGTAFHTPEALLRRVGLFGLTQRSLRRHLAEVMERGEESYRFASEFVAAVNRVNYNQDNGLNALAGMVSMLPATDSRTFKIAGGNERLPRALLSAARVRLKHGWSVNEVRPAKRGGYELHSLRFPGAQRSRRRRPRWEQEVAGPYAAVIIAAPLEHSQLRFKGVGVRPPRPREYQRVITTYVTGALRADYFGVRQLPTDQVLVTETADTPFSVVAPQRRLAGGETLYKLFSRKPLDRHELTRLFHNHTLVDSHDWQAYPHFAPPEQFPDFRLAAGIFYNNAWENAASAMEMSAIAAKNSALLAHEHLTSQWGLERGERQPRRGASGGGDAASHLADA